MAFDQGTRNRLQKLVSDCRKTLTDEFTLQLQQDYGLDPRTGEVTELSRLTHLSDRERHTAALLRETLAHYLSSALAGEKESKAQRQAAIDRIIREQAFTVLNRLAALLMMEARGLLLPAVSQGVQSQAFELYRHVAGTALGETGEAYQTFLFSLFDEFALDLPALFDRVAPQGRLFPRETALNELLALLNEHEVEPLWALDETIGWIYQYFNSQEERKAMRKASQAPRDSRELAVRNQFFTPRYVVEFLVDNTLGRQWFNATGGTTPLRDSCQYLLVKPDEQPEAGIKLRDPRTLKLLDPACGSMHFGLYAFDLFLQIYRDAWQWEQQHGPGSLDLSTQPEAGFEPLCHTYADEGALLRDVPRLIIEHNIYGVDIDPRAAQIASLALWLRAQRAWHEAGVQALERPDVGQGNVIAAVAPPAEKELREAFMARLDRQDAELFEKTLQMLKGLPELGVLLRAEKELSALIRQVYVGKGSDLFAEQEQETWQKAEERLRRALQEFSEEVCATYQSRLFAQDALQGLRMIDLCRVVFDVVVMNPPFGLSTTGTFEWLKKSYPLTYTEVFSSFVSRGNEILREGGVVGAITSRAFLTIKRLQGWREREVVPNLEVLLDLGGQVMDSALVESCAYVLRSGGGEDVIQAVDARGARKNVADEKLFNENVIKKYLVERKDVFSLPGMKVLYSIPPEVHQLLREELVFEPSVGTIRQGMGTFDDFRFVRARWEVKRESVGKDVKWEPLAKGGEYANYYSDIHLLLNWEKDGAELGEVNVQRNGQVSQVRQASEYWRTAGCTYSKRSQKGFSVRALPSNCIITGKGPAILSLSDYPDGYMLGWFNSRLVKFLVELQANYGEYNTGILKQLPWVDPDFNEVPRMSELAEKAALDIRRAQACVDETNTYFSGPPLLGGLKEIHSEVSETSNVVRSRLNDVQREWDDHVDSLFNIDSYKLDLEDVSEDGNELSLASDEANGIDVQDVAHNLLSYCLGVSFGRWGAYRTKPKEELANETPFSPIPIDPPAMVQEDAVSLAKKSLLGLLVDDRDSPYDIASAIFSSMEAAWGQSASKLEREITEALGLNEIRGYFSKPSRFFSSHLSQYSKSRRKAPIYWPLATVWGSYTLWIYYPDLTDQTLFTAVNDFVEPKLKQVDSELGNLRLAGASRSRADEKRLEELSDFRDELADLRDTLLRIAPDYKPNHDDGVQITAAPLWPLFRHKPWQKVLKETWEKLEQGDYDWAHLAMAYWPDRVREKCVTDKSLAIAHDLEQLYVEPEPAPKKTRGRKKSTGSSE